MATLIIALIVATVLGLAVWKLYKDKKAGKLSCGCGCSGCPNSGICHGNNKKENEEE